MLSQVKSKQSLKRKYNGCSQDVRNYFGHIPKLLDEFPMDVCLAYVFSRLELGQNMALYCGAVKIHRVNSELARNAVERQHMDRDIFVKLYKTIFSLDLPKAARQELKAAAEIRNMIMHGKTATDNQIRNAIACVLKYAEDVNKQLHEKYQLKPFVDDLRGFAGSLKKLDRSTSRFVLMGMGFLKSEK